MNQFAFREVGDFLLGMEALSERYREDEEFRSRMASGGAADSLSEFGLPVPAQAEVRVVENTAEIFHLVLPSDPNADLSDELLDTVTGGTGTVDASCWATLISCLSSMMPRQG